MRAGRRRDGDNEQAAAGAARNRLTYYLISLDGEGRLIEHVRIAKREADKALVGELVGPRGQNAVLQGVLERRVQLLAAGLAAQARGAEGGSSRGRCQSSDWRRRW